MFGAKISHKGDFVQGAKFEQAVAEVKKVNVAGLGQVALGDWHSGKIVEQPNLGTFDAGSEVTEGKDFDKNFEQDGVVKNTETEVKMGYMGAENGYGELNNEVWNGGVGGVENSRMFGQVFRRGRELDREGFLILKERLVEENIKKDNPRELLSEVIKIREKMAERRDAGI